MKHAAFLFTLGLTLSTAIGLGLVISSGAQAATDERVQQSVEQRDAQPKFVVELFTSQGCSSCPRANHFVSELAANRSDALVLSYGVTYWDYLGWKDSFGDAAFTARQNEYGKSLGSNNYTPQIVLNGAAHSPNYSESDVISMPLSTSRPKANIRLDKGGDVVISANLPADYNLSLVRYQPGTQKVAVKRGENSGRVLEIENVVMGLDTPNWGGDDLRLPSKLEAGQAYAALFHAPDSSKIITAAILKP